MPLFRSTGSSQREIFDQNFPSFFILNKYEKISAKIVVNFMKVIKHFYFGFLKVKCMLKFTCIFVICRFLLTSKYGNFEEKGIWYLAPGTCFSFGLLSAEKKIDISPLQPGNREQKLLALTVNVHSLWFLLNSCWNNLVLMSLFIKYTMPGQLHFDRQFSQHFEFDCLRWIILNLCR